MMRTIEIVIIIIILFGSMIVASYYAVLPSPRLTFSPNLRELALTTLKTLDANGELRRTIFKLRNDPSWTQLQVALSACLPPNIVFNLTVYDITTQNERTTYSKVHSISSGDLGVSSQLASYTVTSVNVTFQMTPQKINSTLYILNCNDANGWWITGYTAQTLASDIYDLLSPYFQTTIMVQNTTQLGQILNGTSLQREKLQNAVVINTFGEAVPIPTEFCPGGERENESYEPHYDSAVGMRINYTRYCYTLGQKTRQFNWTWVSIVGYPLYYVSNTQVFANEDNTYGIYGMQKVYQGGIIAFLQGLSNKPYQYNSTKITEDVGVVSLAQQVLDSCNYYGIYPSPSQTSTRALNLNVLTRDYGLTIGLSIFNNATKSNVPYSPGALYLHKEGTNVTGSLMALGLTRTPDIRLTALGLLSYYRPMLYPSELTATGGSRPTCRFVVLQLAQQGGF
jgi:hypothetical protein